MKPIPSQPSQTPPKVSDTKPIARTSANGDPAPMAKSGTHLPELTQSRKRKSQTDDVTNETLVPSVSWGSEQAGPAKLPRQTTQLDEHLDNAPSFTPDTQLTRSLPTQGRATASQHGNAMGDESVASESDSELIRPTQRHKRKTPGDEAYDNESVPAADNYSGSGRATKRRTRVNQQDKRQDAANVAFAQELTENYGDYVEPGFGLRAHTPDPDRALPDRALPYKEFQSVEPMMRSGGRRPRIRRTTKAVSNAEQDLPPLQVSQKTNEQDKSFDPTGSRAPGHSTQATRYPDWASLLRDGPTGLFRRVPIPQDLVSAEDNSMQFPPALSEGSMTREVESLKCYGPPSVAGSWKHDDSPEPQQSEVLQDEAPLNPPSPTPRTQLSPILPPSSPPPFPQDEDSVIQPRRTPTSYFSQVTTILGALKATRG